jgi:hypothetical protein
MQLVPLHRGLRRLQGWRQRRRLRRRRRRRVRVRDGGGEDSLLPRGFPSEDDLLECETEEEKEELCDKADLIVEKLEAKVGAVQVESSLPISLKAPGFNP